MKIKQGDAKATLAAHRERDRARRYAKWMAEVCAMPADEVPTEGAQWSVSCDMVNVIRSWIKAGAA
ncbi:MAG: hypothetical protein IKJ37_07965, partial [Kiritimatiellae bacterium]|nr:hypothetical protein [Kiritimatiellia bacterium]